MWLPPCLPPRCVRCAQTAATSGKGGDLAAKRLLGASLCERGLGEAFPFCVCYSSFFIYCLPTCKMLANNYVLFHEKVFHNDTCSNILILGRPLHSPAYRHFERRPGHCLDPAAPPMTPPRWVWGLGFWGLVGSLTSPTLPMRNRKQEYDNARTETRNNIASP